MNYGYISLLPSLVTLFLVFYTGRTLTSLFVGAFSAALIVANFSPHTAILLLAKKLWNTTEFSLLLNFNTWLDAGHLFLLGFILVLSCVIAMIRNSGTYACYAEFIRTKLKGRVGSELSSMALSTYLFIDDYLSALTVSKVMPSITDRFRVPRLKIAFLTTAFSAPLCTLTPISSWGAAILSYLAMYGIHDRSGSLISLDSFYALYRSVPFVFFSIFLPLSAIWIVVNRLSLGLIKKHESIAQNSGNLFGGTNKTKKPLFNKECDETSPLFFIIPVTVTTLSIFCSLLIMGKFYLFGGSNNFIEAIKAAPAEISVFCGSLAALIINLIFYRLASKKIKIKLGKTLSDGFWDIKDILLLLIIAWTFGSFLTDDLKTGEFLAEILKPLLHKAVLPFIIFALASIISFAIGSSWATMPILFSIVIPMVAKQFPGSANLIIFPCIGAILSGVVFGSSMSPTADLLLMTSKNAEVDHAEYVENQIQYLIPIGIAAGISYLTAGSLIIDYGYTAAVSTSLAIGLALSFGLFYILGKK